MLLPAYESLGNPVASTFLTHQPGVITLVIREISGLKPAPRSVLGIIHFFCCIIESNKRTLKRVQLRFPGLRVERN